MSEVELGWLAVMAAGLIVSIEPCALTIDLLVIGYIMGSTGAEDPGMGFRKGFVSGFAFIMGRALTYAFLGAGASVAGSTGYLGTFASRALGPILVVLGLVMLGFVDIPAVGYGALGRWRDCLARRGLVGVFLLGVLLGLAIYPCSTPVLVAILAGIAAGEPALRAAGLLLVYGLAVGAPIPFIASGAVSARTIVEKMHGTSDWLKRTAGLLLIGYGLYYVVSQL